MQEENSMIGIYNIDGNLVGTKSRSEVDNHNDILKAVYVLLFDERNRIFMIKAKDELWKGKWGGSCGGLVKENETTLEAANRTMKKELGAETALHFIGEKFHDFSGVKRFVNVFSGRAKAEIQPCFDDILEGKWVEFDAVQEMVTKGETMPTFKASFDLLGIKI